MCTTQDDLKRQQLLNKHLHVYDLQVYCKSNSKSVIRVKSFRLDFSSNFSFFYVLYLYILQKIHLYKEKCERKNDTTARMIKSLFRLLLYNTIKQNSQTNVPTIITMKLS